MADLKQLAADLGNRDWKWWDSCSFRRLTFEDGPHRQDGSALHGTVQASDGHPHVQMAPRVREFIEAASPMAIAALIASHEAALAEAKARLDDWEASWAAFITWHEKHFGRFEPTCPAHSDRLNGWQACAADMRSRLYNLANPTLQPENRTEALHG